MSDRIQHVRNFLTGGGSICPFAKRYAERTGFAEVPEVYRTHQIRYPLLDLVKSSELMAAVYVFASDLPNHVEERSRSAALFKDISRVLITDEYGLEADEVFSAFKPWIDEALSAGSDKNPFLVHREKRFFYIAMNPLYPQNHPRWLPCSSVVITRGEDVDNADSRIRRAIENEMKRRTGSVYDADQFYLMPTIYS